VGFLGNPHPGRARVLELAMLDKDMSKIKLVDVVTPHRHVCHSP